MAANTLEKNLPIANAAEYRQIVGANDWRERE
jgi:hypothetical protein